MGNDDYDHDLHSEEIMSPSSNSSTTQYYYTPYNDFLPTSHLDHHRDCTTSTISSTSTATMEAAHLGCLQELSILSPTWINRRCYEDLRHEHDDDNIVVDRKPKLLLRDVQQDHPNFLLRLKHRITRVGIELPSVEVRFEDLKVEAEARRASRALPSLYNFTANLFEDLLSYFHILESRKTQVCILNNLSGILKPSRMGLLLGPPSSGKTTFLTALAGQLDPSLKVSGSVAFNGHGMKEFVAQRTAAYVGQHDKHIGEMTVRETIAFSATCQGSQFLSEVVAEVLRRERQHNIKPADEDDDINAFMQAMASGESDEKVDILTEYVIKILGLEDCADTIVGNEMRRGISGGQKKRLTIGEMLVGPARVFLMDEISNGLDASTTFHILNSIRHTTQILNSTVLVSLLQPPPETFDLFDDIYLLSDDGRIVYQGPRQYVLHFFHQMGFTCPPRKAVADFLQEVISRNDQEQYWVDLEKPYHFVTVKEFEDAFQSFHVGKSIQEELSTPFEKGKSHPSALATQKYGATKKELLKACIGREFLLMKRNSLVHIFKLVQLVLMGIILMTLFLRTEMTRDSVLDGVVYMGALFFIVIMVILNGMVEQSLNIAKLPVFYKQRNYGFYPPWAFSLPPSILQIPTAFLEAAVWVFITYFTIGFDPDLSRFFKQYFLLIISSQMSNALFRMISGLGRTAVLTNLLAGFTLLTLLALSGFVMSRENINKFWIWGYWASPFMYAQHAIVVNEFLGKSWSHIPPNSTVPLGVQVLKSRGFFTKDYWYWIGIAGLVGYTLLLNLGFTLSLMFLNPLDKPQAIASRDDFGNNELRSQDAMRMESIVDDRKKKAMKKKKGMVLPFQPHFITFEGITYSVDMPKEMKNHGSPDKKLMLLNNISGCFRPGVLTALMGITGAGKTTLLDVLAGRKTAGYVHGRITISGYPKNQQTFARIAGYCEQTDIHSPLVTVNESLIHSAWLRLPNEVDTQTRKMFVEEVMGLVELKNLRNAIVGLPGVSGLSIEQRKRLTIAVELVANPSIIFMDEPTSGLDARAAAIVMRTVRNTVDTGRTVVCTIHQPSVDIFESFDELFLLKRGGQEIYVGPLGINSCHMIQYFEGVRGIKKINQGYNPATWMLDITKPAVEAELGVDFATTYRQSKLYKTNRMTIRRLSKPAPGSSDLYFPSKYSTSVFTQSVACLWKLHKSYWRNLTYTGARLFFTTTIALMFGTMFWNLGKNTTKEQDLFNAFGSMYGSVFFIGVQNALSVQPVIDVERSVLYRERAVRMYAGFPFAIAQAMIEIPYVFVQALLYSTIMYPLIGYDLSPHKSLWFFFIMFFTLLYFTFYGLMTLALTPNQHIAYVLSGAFYGLWNLFSGFVVPRTRIPVWWRWYYWANPVAWTLNGLLTSQYGDDERELESGITIRSFLKLYYDFESNQLRVVATVIVGFGLLFGFVFAVSIKHLNFQKR
ncbi:Pleiotropic drug resistance protein 1 [Linum perenne]